MIAAKNPSSTTSSFTPLTWIKIGIKKDVIHDVQKKIAALAMPRYNISKNMHLSIYRDFFSGKNSSKNSIYLFFRDFLVSLMG